MHLEEQRRVQFEADMARLEREVEQREQHRRIEDHREIQKKVAKERLKQLKSTSIGVKAFADLSEDVQTFIYFLPFLCVTPVLNATAVRHHLS